MTPEHRYIAGLYEACVDRDLDLAQIRAFLASRGIIRSTFQVADDLDRVYSFAGYAASHQLAPALTAKEWDAQIGS